MSELDTVAEVPVSALVLVETMTPAKLFEPGSIDPILDRIKAEVRATKKDISTEKGRKAIASLAYKISRTKSFIDDQRITLVSDEKKRLARIDAEGKRIREELDALRDETRKPLTDWENAEKARINAHENALDRMTEYGMRSGLRSVADVEREIDDVNSIYITRQWQEFSARAIEVRDNVLSILSGVLKDSRRAEDERAELERLRRENEERLQREHDERIAREAREKAECEAKKREEAMARAVAAERQRIEREKEAAEERARKAEADRIAAEQAADAKRIANHQFALGRLRAVGNFAGIENVSASALEQRIAMVQADERDWEEFTLEAEEIKTQVLTLLEESLTSAREREHVAAEKKVETERQAAIEAERRKIEAERQAEEKKKAKRYAVTVDRNIGAVTISLRMAEQIVNSLLIAGYADYALEDLDRFVSGIGDTPETIAVGKAALKSIREGWTIQ